VSQAVKQRRRLLTVGHSYVIGLNRRLAHEMARVGASDWEITCVAPTTYHADLGLVSFSHAADEACATLAVPAYVTRSPHLFAYGTELRALLRQPWDAVYSWEEPYVVSGFQIAKWARKDAIFAFLTLQNIRKRYPPPFSWFEKASLARADGWFYCGHSIYAAQRDKPGYSERPSRLGPLGVDTEVFHPDREARERTRRALGWDPDGPPVVGFVGRFVAEKGIRVLMHALGAASEPWRALFIGGGPLEDEIRRWASGQGDRVRIVTASHADVPAYVNALDLLAAPSETKKNWAEQFGRMLVEAFACGVPVIGSDSGEIPYVLADAGIVVREGDRAAWTRAIDELLGDAEKRTRCGERGLARAREVYAWPVVARAYLEFFEELREHKSER
jgi:glycosyltransferase involved in cell wall biosynthesis